MILMRIKIALLKRYNKLNEKIISQENTIIVVRNLLKTSKTWKKAWKEARPDVIENN